MVHFRSIIDHNDLLVLFLVLYKFHQYCDYLFFKLIKLQQQQQLQICFLAAQHFLEVVYRDVHHTGGRLFYTLKKIDFLTNLCQG
jgi:hypothetical protein